MARLIDADALERKIAEHKAQKTMGLLTAERRFAYEWTKSDMYGLVKNAPTIDAEPVQHGRWMNPRMNKYGHPCHHCSECGFLASQKDRNYCPNCGAKMDGGAEDG